MSFTLSRAEDQAGTGITYSLKSEDTFEITAENYFQNRSVLYLEELTLEPTEVITNITGVVGKVIDPFAEKYDRPSTNAVTTRLKLNGFVDPTPTNGIDDREPDTELDNIGWATTFANAGQTELRNAIETTNQDYQRTNRNYHTYLLELSMYRASPVFIQQEELSKLQDIEFIITTFIY